ncbi:hypothetical protein BDW22DRAFT_1348228 [Trametopsis cervina]|nr:hypothetical protein BDW22DRAFT_1348228 [Trametopsis cervina]
MTYSPTLTSSPNSPYNLHLRPASADLTAYLGLQQTIKHASFGPNSPPSSTPTHTEGTSPSDSDSDCGTQTAGEPLHSSPMAEERREDNSKDKGKGRASSRNVSPSGSSSQGDMADTEMEAGAAGPSEQTEQPPPPKKKRTRTLTTPHQAAVLHALLAQSRFPTTAMREEVGRAIGLSARKVQASSQEISSRTFIDGFYPLDLNQRQKARRPRGQNVPPLTRPPQYGPFPSTTSGSSHGELSMAPDSSFAGSTQTSRLRAASFTSPTELDPAWHELRSSEAYQGPAGFSAQLSGPGIPGGSTGPSSPDTTRAPTADPVRPRTGYPVTSGHRSPTVARPWTTEQNEPLYTIPRPTRSSSHRRSADFAVRLPPLRLTRPRSRTFAESGASRGAPSSAHILSPRSPTRLPPLQPDSPFAFEAPLRIPPPFTLQPQPQWDDPSFSPFSRPPPHTGAEHSISSGERIVLTPPSGHDGDLTLPPAQLPRIPLSPGSPLVAPHMYQPTSPTASLPGPSLPWRIRRPDDDKSPRDHDVPR